jgi:hypothetical protein
MKAIFAPWSGRNKSISRVQQKAVAVVTMIAALFVVGVLSHCPAAFAADYATIHFYPSPACVGVGDTVYLKMYGWAWGALGTKWKSDDSGIAAASGQGVVTGMSAGTTKLRLKDGFGQTIKTVSVTVMNDMADCASFYMPGVDLTPPQYESGSDAFSFVFVSDTQGCAACSMAGGANLVDHDFAHAFANHIVTDPTAFVVNGGDLAGLGGMSSDPYGRQWLDDIGIVWRPDQYAIPVYAVVGNHDLTRWVLGESWKSKQSDWQNILWPGYFADGGKPWPTNSSSAYHYLTYSFSWGNSIFIFTDMLYMWGNSGNDQDWQGNMMIQELNPEQVAYVKYILKWARDNNKEHAFIFGHPPLIASGSTTAKGNNKAVASSTLLSAYNLSGAYMGGHTNGLTYRSLGNSYEQFTAETGGGDTNPNSYLRVYVDGSNYSVQANFLAHGSTQWYTTADATWNF